MSWQERLLGFTSYFDGWWIDLVVWVSLRLYVLDADLIRFYVHF